MTYASLEREQSYNLVILGAGTGGSTVAAGFVDFPGVNVTLVENPYDNGGSSKGLRVARRGLIAVGDTRQGLLALSNAPQALKDYWNSRYTEADGPALAGHAVGNLILADAICERDGDVYAALDDVAAVYDLGMWGRVLPVTAQDANLHITLPDGEVFDGEHEAEESKRPSFYGSHIGFDIEDVKIDARVEQAIVNADMVMIAPGDLYTSIGPLLATGGMREALDKAGPKLLVSNLMNRPTHTVGYEVRHYIEEYERILGAPGMIDYALVNIGDFPSAALQKQRQQGSRPVRIRARALRRTGVTAIGADLISQDTPEPAAADALAASRSTIRHDGEKVAAETVKLLHGLSTSEPVRVRSRQATIRVSAAA